MIGEGSGIMELDSKIGIEYEGKVLCDICGRELELGEKVETIQKGMYIEDCGDNETMVQFGEDQETFTICKDCSPRVKVIVK